jgi:NAD(P)-dependent dehydrogenase (short-subunit alcohol dehydrogenase family)
VGQRLKNKVCIITGTGDGMGRAAALLFCAEGANVVGCDLNAQKAELTLRDAKSVGGQMVSLHPADLTQQHICDASPILRSRAMAASTTTMLRPPISAG